jgi:acetylornithine/N-succinyldiaminopimelate aminotransferase
MSQVATPKKAAPAGTLADDLKHSPAVKDAIDTIVSEIRARASQLTDIRPPSPGLKETYESLMKRAGEVRGRGLLYPYLGSGVGNGALVELADGSVKWDMICGIGVHFFGHSDPDLIAEGLRGSMEDTLKHGNLQSGFEPYRLCETMLAEAAKGSRLKHAYLSPGGALANENAIKVCYQKHSPASRIIAFRDCFMGRTVTMSQIGDTAAYRVGIPLSTQVDYMPFWDPVAAGEMGKQKFIDMGVRKLREYIERYPKQHAAFIFELVQGEGGFNVGDRDYFKALMDICKENSIAVWDDEIQTFGRLNRMFAYEVFDLGQYVDVLTVGKMTQACFTLFTADYNPGPGLLSGTFLGEGPSFRIGTRVIERLRDGNYYGPGGLFVKHHAAFIEQVGALASRRPDLFPKVPSIPDVAGGMGGMMRFTPFGGDKDKIVKACRTCFDEGVILFYAGHGPHHMRILPPLPVFPMEAWPKVFACIERGLSKV